MTLYIAKMILCSGLFYAGYKLFLEQLSAKHFNRFYLLGSLVFPIMLPLFEYKLKAEETFTPLFKEYPTELISNLRTVEPSVFQEDNPLPIGDILLWGYIFITAVFLIRRIIMLSKLLRSDGLSTQVKYAGHSITLVERNTTPHSFLHKIFISRSDYEAGIVRKEILEHELTHVRQKHSLDIIFFELVQAIAWINPFHILFGKSIRLNHEFLADREVIKKTNNPGSYQYMLIGLSPTPDPSGLASSLNYSLTKKRLIMMSRKTSRLKIAIGQCALLPVILVAVSFSCLEIQAQVPVQQVPNKIKDTNSEGYYLDSNSKRPYIVRPGVPSTQEGVSQETLNAYQKEIDKYKLDDGRYQMQKISKSDREKLEKIYYKMSREQQLRQMVAFIPNSNVPRAKQSPTQKQYDDWKNSKMYGIWIDNRRVSNQELEKYDPQDFKCFDISKLMKTAINYGKHYYQVNLMTGKEYDLYAARTRAATGSFMLTGRLEKLTNTEPK